MISGIGMTGGRRGGRMIFGWIFGGMIFGFFLIGTVAGRPLMARGGLVSASGWGPPILDSGDFSRPIWPVLDCNPRPARSWGRRGWVAAVDNRLEWLWPAPAPTERIRQVRAKLEDPITCSIHKIHRVVVQLVGRLVEVIRNILNERRRRYVLDVVD